MSPSMIAPALRGAQAWARAAASRALRSPALRTGLARGPGGAQSACCAQAANTMARSRALPRRISPARPA
eukprot:9961852-Lingulodinium_polyedra.AAC.1